MYDILLERGFQQLRKAIKNCDTNELFLSSFKEQIIGGFNSDWPATGLGSYPVYGVANGNGQEPKFFMRRKISITGDKTIIDLAIEQTLIPYDSSQIIYTRIFNSRSVTLTYYSPVNFNDDTRQQAIQFFADSIGSINNAFKDIRRQFEEYKKHHSVDELITQAIEREITRRKRKGSLI